MPQSFQIIHSSLFPAQTAERNSPHPPSSIEDCERHVSRVSVHEARGKSPTATPPGSCGSACSDFGDLMHHEYIVGVKPTHGDPVHRSTCASLPEAGFKAAEVLDGDVAQFVEATVDAADAGPRIVQGNGAEVLELFSRGTVADFIASEKAAFQSRLEVADRQCAEALREQERLSCELQAARADLLERLKLEARHHAEQQKSAAAARASMALEGAARAKLCKQLAAADAEISALRGDAERLWALPAEELEVLSETLAGALACVQREHRRKMLERANEHLCNVCMTERKDSLLQPCHHLALCSGCSVRVQYCPQCRSTITGRLKVYT